MDCGVSSTLVFTNLSSVAQTVTVDGSPVSVGPYSSLPLFCSGQMDIISALPLIRLSTGYGEAVAALLLGLAGIICAALVVKSIFLFFGVHDAS